MWMGTGQGAAGAPGFASDRMRLGIVAALALALAAGGCATSGSTTANLATERGASMVEYILLVALIAVVCIVAISFVSADTDAHFRLIEKRHHLRLERERIPGFEPTILEPTVPLRDPHGGVKGKRKSKKDKLREAAARKA